MAGLSDRTSCLSLHWQWKCVPLREKQPVCYQSFALHQIQTFNLAVLDYSHCTVYLDINVKKQGKHICNSV